ncbi:MAG TPA: hypothetical protein VFA39_20155 [Steroidobacteraceae bacterium]|nr:hypothetical protein [Steroidobacteraceae bacterium]
MNVTMFRRIAVEDSLIRRRLAACAATLVLAGCATVSGVAPAGDHLYTVSAIDHTGATSPMGLLERANERAEAYCGAGGNVAQRVETHPSGGILVTGETIEFRCVAKPPPVPTLREGLNGLVGKNIREAISHLGYPDSQATILGDVVYTWRHTMTVDRPKVVTSSTSATTWGIFDSVDTTANTTSVSRGSVTLECKIRVGTSETGTVKNYQLEGPLPACAYFDAAFQAPQSH